MATEEDIEEKKTEDDTKSSWRDKVLIPAVAIIVLALATVIGKKLEKLVPDEKIPVTNPVKGGVDSLKTTHYIDKGKSAKTTDTSKRKAPPKFKYDAEADSILNRIKITSSFVDERAQGREFVYTYKFSGNQADIDRITWVCLWQDEVAAIKRPKNPDGLSNQGLADFSIAQSLTGRLPYVMVQLFIDSKKCSHILHKIPVYLN